jgi:opacity protein-like surface antigen
MKKIVFFFSLFVFVFGFSFSDYEKYVSVGFGVCNSDKYDGFDISTDFGYKNSEEKFYLSLSNINFDTQNDFGIFSYSLNYDKFLLTDVAIKPFLGGGVNFMEIGDDSGVYAHKFGFNAKAGILYNITTHWALNLRGVYTYINHKDVKYTYGATLNLEYQF